MDLTKMSEKVLCVLYSVYLQKRKEGVLLRDARKFTDPDYKRLTEESKIQYLDARDILWELTRANYVRSYITGGFYLTDTALIYLENRFENKIEKVLDVIGKIKGVIPFV